MVELLMVVVLIGALSAAAIPQFLDFRNEGRASTTKFILNSMRIGIKNQLNQAQATMWICR